VFLKEHDKKKESLNILAKEGVLKSPVEGLFLILFLSRLEHDQFD